METNIADPSDYGSDSPKILVFEKFLCTYFDSGAIFPFALKTKVLSFF